VSNPFKLITTNVLGTLTEVRIYSETVAHIQEEHPEVPILLPSIETAVTKTLQNPTHIEGSYGNSVVFVDSETTNSSGDPLRVPVKIINGTSGRLRTVYFATPSGPKNVIWRRV
jgi:hypothetical protein